MPLPNSSHVLRNDLAAADTYVLANEAGDSVELVYHLLLLRAVLSVVDADVSNLSLANWEQRKVKTSEVLRVVYRLS